MRRMEIIWLELRKDCVLIPLLSLNFALREMLCPKRRRKRKAARETVLGGNIFPIFDWQSFANCEQSAETKNTQKAIAEEEFSRLTIWARLFPLSSPLFSSSLLPKNCWKRFPIWRSKLANDYHKHSSILHQKLRPFFPFFAAFYHSFRCVLPFFATNLANKSCMISLWYLSTSFGKISRRFQLDLD